MDKKSKEVIKEAIFFLLKMRSNRLFNQEFGENSNGNDDGYMKAQFRKKTLHDYKNNGLTNIVDENLEYIDSLDKQLISLNSILDKKDKVQEVLDIEQYMKKLQSKKYINVKEFTEIYGYASDWQKNRRGRIRDRLPFHQEKRGGKIIYNVKEIEQWFENNNLRN